MGPSSEAHDDKIRKSSEAPPAAVRHAANTPTTLRLLSDHDLELGKKNGERLEEYDCNQRDMSEDYGQGNANVAGRKLPRAISHDERFSDEEGTFAAEIDATVSLKEKTPPTRPSPTLDGRDDSSPSRIPDLSQVPSMANSLASLSVDSQAPMSSIQSSPRSLSRQSLKQDEEASIGSRSQAITSDSEDEAPDGHRNVMQDSSPQLIMPSIRMPSRRPFTERGKALGRLRILLAGAQGTGKTTLIKSIVQTCEDIVHIDPISSNSSSILQAVTSHSRSRRSSSKGTREISEVYASTRPYPSWRSETEGLSLPGRRKSMGDTVLERNLCFVDTPGLHEGLSPTAGSDRALDYLADQARKSFSTTSGDGDVIGLLSGSGGVQVDLVLYLISTDIGQEDISFLKRISHLTNVIVLLSKSDNRSIEETGLLRRSLNDQLERYGIHQFHFPKDGSRQAPFAVCSIPSDDDDNMDASLLMSSEYVQPLVPSDLSILLDQAFQSETVACMRHLAAKKLVEAQSSSLAPGGSSYSSRGAQGSHRVQGKAPFSVSTLSTSLPRAHALSPFIQASISDHTIYEERLAQIRLAKWAADLQRSLQNERQRYDSLMREEQAAWLNRKLDELKQRDQADNVGERTTTSQFDGLIFGSKKRHDFMKDQDPLGIIYYYEEMKQNGWMALRVAGSFGVIGAFAVWMVRNWSSGHWEVNWWKGA